jgi:hypothetical protein
MNIAKQLITNSLPLFVLILLISSCTQTAKQPMLSVPPLLPTDNQSTTNTPIINEKNIEPKLSYSLKRGCVYPQASNFNTVGLPTGEMAIDFTLDAINNNKVNLANLLRDKPVVMVFGSFT